MTARTYRKRSITKGDKRTDTPVKPVGILSLMLKPLGACKTDKVRGQRAFERTLQSLVAQGLPHWQWWLGVSPSNAISVDHWLKASPMYEVAKSKVRIVVCDAKQPVLALRNLLDRAESDWISMCWVGDAFASHFVYESLRVALTRPNVSLMYFDDDVVKNPKLTSLELNRHLPQFKPEFSLDLLLARNYIGLSFATKTELFSQALKNISAESRQEQNFPYALGLDLIRQALWANKLSRLDTDYPIMHVPSVLRHRDLGCPESVMYEQSKAALLSAKRCVAKFIKQQEGAAKVSLLENGSLKVDWSLPKGGAKALPKVSIIVPTKDQFKILKKCIDSLIKKTDYANLELIIVDNQTTEPKALAYLTQLQAKYSFVTVLKYAKPFNFSAINNWAAEVATGDVLVLMNNDVEVIDGGWLKALVRHAIRPDVGCVGAKLLFPDRTIQHAGVAVGMHGVADHMYRGLRESKRNDPYANLQTVRNPLAVTAAVLAIRRSLFEELGGFDARRFKVAFNDVDLCLRAEAAGYRTVWTPDARLIHHESKTRAPRTMLLNDIGVKARARERQEVASMKRRWGWLLKRKQEALGNRFTQLRVF